MYSLNLFERINEDCTSVNVIYPININISDINVVEQSNGSIVTSNMQFFTQVAIYCYIIIYVVI